MYTTLYFAPTAKHPDSGRVALPSGAFLSEREFKETAPAHLGPPLAQLYERERQAPRPELRVGAALPLSLKIS